MNGWERLQSDPGGCCLGRGQVDTGAGALNRRNEPVYLPQYVTGTWPNGTDVLIWDVLKAADPPGEWLLCQAVSGPTTLYWSHSSGIVRVLEHERHTGLLSGL